MEAYRTLDWDTQFFGFKVAQITRPSLDPEQLTMILNSLQEAGVRLAYWPSETWVPEGSDRIVEKRGGYLVDEKTTFVVDVDNASLAQVVPIAVVQSYDPTMATSDMVALAIQSGEYSRFALDPNIPRDKFIELYSIWINRSLNRELVDEVLVICEDMRVAGMITLGNKNGRGDIGLVAVDADFRGRGFGQNLVRAAQKWFFAERYTQVQVVTQGKNASACNLYKKCGFSIEKVEYFYHFWL